MYKRNYQSKYTMTSTKNNYESKVLNSLTYIPTLLEIGHAYRGRDNWSQILFLNNNW